MRHGDGATMPYYGILNYGKAQTGASGLTRPPFIHAVEAFEQSGQMLVVHAHAVVCYSEYCIVLGAFQTNIYDGPPTVSYGIVY